MKHSFRLSVILSLLFLYSYCSSKEQAQATAKDTIVAPADTLPVVTEEIIASQAMPDKKISVNIILPANYHSDTTARFPVVYLLHGFSDSYATYYEKIPHLTDLATRHQILIVCPDGGYGSWYIDSKINPKSQYESHVVREVIPFVDKTFRTKADAAHRAITGHSMGGHGALYLAIRHQDIFGAAGSMSGGVDLTFDVNSWHIAKQLGDYEANKTIWHENSVINMVSQLRKPYMPILFDCGTDDFFFQINRNLHKKMLELGIPHDYIERPGAHNWPYWDNAVDYQMLFFSRYFNR